MIDLHTHSLFSDGELVPSELIRRAAYAGYKAIAITDHGDSSNLDLIIPNIVKVCMDVSNEWDIKAIPGIELTHVPPRIIADLTTRARKLGAGLVVVHGETIAEPVCKGTNLAAIKAKIDILAHPGLFTREEAILARDNGVCIEISGRKGHSLTNGHIVALSREIDFKLVVNSDAHAPGDLMPLDFARRVALGAGMTEDEFERARGNAGELVAKAG
jgi:histidinol phosphatase-like PHP family hydrolase